MTAWFSQLQLFLTTAEPVEALLAVGHHRQALGMIVAVAAGNAHIAADPWRGISLMLMLTADAAVAAAEVTATLAERASNTAAAVAFVAL